jgi:hypothetical protein
VYGMNKGRTVALLYPFATNQKQELLVVAMFVNRSGQISIIYRGPSIDASYQVSVHLAMRFQRRRF